MEPPKESLIIKALLSSISTPQTLIPKILLKLKKNNKENNNKNLFIRQKEEKEYIK
jgi:hypothetical protein